MTSPDYTIHPFDRGKTLDYSDGQGQLWLQHGFAACDRIYAADTAKLPFSRRERVLANVFDFFQAAIKRLVLIVDEDDKDRAELERLVTRLAAEGQKLTIEYDSSQKRDETRSVGSSAGSGAARG